MRLMQRFTIAGSLREGTERGPITMYHSVMCYFAIIFGCLSLGQSPTIPLIFSLGSYFDEFLVNKFVLCIM